MLAFAFICELSAKHRVYRRSWPVRKYCRSWGIPLRSSGPI